MTDSGLNESWVTAETSQGTEIRGSVLRLKRHLLVFENTVRTRFNCLTVFICVRNSASSD
jgi:hypothetical protein